MSNEPDQSARHYDFTAAVLTIGAHRFEGVNLIHYEAPRAYASPVLACYSASLSFVAYRSRYWRRRAEWKQRRAYRRARA